MVQWVRLCASTAGDSSLIPGWGSRIPHDMGCSQIKRERCGNSLAVQWLRFGVSTARGAGLIPSPGDCCKQDSMA